MGNQLVSSVKTVIKPIDYYLAEMSNEMKLKQSLGQTQFLKVALCLCGSEGDVVVKVLSHEDPSLLLEPYKEEILAFDRATASHPSIASFRIVEIRPNFAYMVRQFVRFSLYDRLSTRPFLTDIEKCWIVYQILRCMDWCHQRGIVHGDIKLENILVTSNLWVILTDFATYKPVSLPEDNPSFFNYFFDTSRRRCCNIAPERFVPTASLNTMDTPLSSSTTLSSMANQESGVSVPGASAPSPTSLSSPLTDKMDMFSIGCTLAEIFSEAGLFDLSSLLAYKEAREHERIEEVLHRKIDSPVIRGLVTNLISLDPSARKSCATLLDELRGHLFPLYFDRLYSMMRTLVRLPPDSKILYLAQERATFLPLIAEEGGTGLLLIFSTLTSTLRSLKHVHCKIEAQRLIVHLVSSQSVALSPYITDRLVPYLAHVLAKEPDHRVRGEAITSLADLLEHVHAIPASDSNIFTDYLLDILIKALEAEKSVYVRLAMAQNVGRLSTVAYRFLNQSCEQNYDEELSLLHSSFNTLVVHLLTDASNCVRRALLLTPDNCAHLCTFFGRQKTNDVILPHIFTFLNHKNDFQLRLAFFDNIIVIASYLGVQCSTILHPLLQQGLCDAEEVIICKTVNSVAELAEQGLLQKNVIYDLLREILPLVYHPNGWITNAIVNLLHVLSSTLSPIDLQYKVLRLLGPYLCRPLHSLSNQYLLHDALHRPLPRHVFDIVLESKDSIGLFESLRNRKANLGGNLAFKRLEAEEIGPVAEAQLLKLSELLVKIHRNRRNYLTAMHTRDDDQDGSQITYNDYEKLVRSVNLVDSFNLEESGSGANQEWQHMFGPHTKNLLEETAILSGAGADLTIDGAAEAREMDRYSYFDCPPCSQDVRALLTHKKLAFTPATPVRSPNSHLSMPFKPKGFLVSQMYEHRASINSMARYGNTSCFFTASDDGTIRLWDLAYFEGKHLLNRSKMAFKGEFNNGEPINFKTIICCGPYTVTHSHEGIIYIFETGDAAMSLVANFKPGHALAGCGAAASGKSSGTSSIPAVITSMVALSPNVFAVSLTNSFIYGYDIRHLNSPRFFVPIFKTRLPPNQRTITSIDGAEVVLFAGTACGYIAAFDMRFNIKVNYFNQGHSSSSSGGQPTAPRIAKLKYSTQGLYVSTYGTSDVTLWDYKIAHREKVLRTAKRETSKDGTQEEASNSATRVILPVGNASPGVITAGSDQRIRYWDLKAPDEGYVISDPQLRPCHYMGKVATQTTTGPPGTAPTGKAVTVQNLCFDHSGPMPLLATYRAAIYGDHQVIEESDASRPYEKTPHYCALEHQSTRTGHQDTITDLLAINHYLVSSGRNGTIKVWR